MGSALKGADGVSRRAAKLVALVEGGAIEVVVPDSDEGSGSNSSMRQHVPTGGDHRTTVGEESGMLTFVRSTNPQFMRALLGSGVLMPIIRSPDPSVSGALVCSQER
ncbi:hypothetical protein ACLOJK_023922 [Asimina triloba]